MTSHQTSSVRRHILSLPTEILTIITLHLDTSSALSLAQTCRRMLKPAETRIWRSLNLVIPKHYGQYPLIRPCFDSPEYTDWAVEQAKSADGRRRLATSEHIRDILCAGDRRKFGLVKGVIVEPTRGNTYAILQLLDLVKDNVEILVIEAQDKHPFDDQWTTPNSQSLWGLFSSFRLDPHNALSKLSQLDITLSHRDCLESVNDLILLCPSLRYLRLDLRAVTLHDCTYYGQECTCKANEHTLFGRFSYQETKLPNLKHIDIRCTLLYNPDYYNSLNQLLECSPNLASLKIDSRDSKGNCTEILDTEDLFDEQSSEGLTKVEQLEWLIESASELSKRLKNKGAGHFNKVQHGVFISDIRSLAAERIEFLPSLPVMNLETLIITTIPKSAYPDLLRHSRPPCAFTDDISQVQGIHQSIVNRVLIRHPNLRVIQFVAADCEQEERELIPSGVWASKGIRGIVIRSFKHEKEELYHVRTLTHSTREPPRIRGTPPDNVSAGYKYPVSITYPVTPGNNGFSTETFIAGSHLEWEDATYYKGEVVPLHIITRMRQAADVVSGEWEGRGIRVCKRAWRVLTSWMKDKGKTSG